MTDKDKHDRAANVVFYVCLACFTAVVTCGTYAFCAWLLSLV